VNGRKSSPRRWTTLAATLAAVTAAALVAGVGVTSANPNATVTLKVLAQSTGQGGNQQVQAVIANFEKANPDINVEAEYLPIGTTYANSLRTRLQGGNAPDVFYVTPGSGGLQAVLPLARAGYVADLSSRPWAKRVPANSRSMYFIGNRLYAVPIQIVPVGVLYQPNLYRELGIRVPTTTAQLLAACRTAASKGKALMNIAGASAQNAGLFATVVAGSHVLAADRNWNQRRLANRVTFSNTATWRRALQRIVDMKNAGCFPRGAEAADNVPATGPFVSGQALSWTLPSSIIGLLKGINPRIQLNAYAFPGDTAAATRLYASPSDAFAMYSRTQQRAAATRFIDFWAREGQSRLYAKLTGAISLSQANTGKVPTPELQGIAPILRGGTKVFPLMQLEWRNPEVFETLGKGVQALLTGQKTPQAVLAELDAAWSRA
jgi:raffinose/stachyose/melibiose transport system substrate-binding protein